jgi:hypothetical protein
VLDVLG